MINPTVVPDVQGSPSAPGTRRATTRTPPEPGSGWWKVWRDRAGDPGAYLRGQVAGSVSGDAHRRPVGHHVVPVPSPPVGRDDRQLRARPARLVDLVPAEPVAVRATTRPSVAPRPRRRRDHRAPWQRPRDDPLVTVELRAGSAGKFRASANRAHPVRLPQPARAAPGHAAPAIPARRTAAGARRLGDRVEPLEPRLQLLDPARSPRAAAAGPGSTATYRGSGSPDRCSGSTASSPTSALPARSAHASRTRSTHTAPATAPGAPPASRDRRADRRVYRVEVRLGGDRVEHRPGQYRRLQRELQRLPLDQPLWTVHSGRSRAPWRRTRRRYRPGRPRGRPPAAPARPPCRDRRRVCGRTPGASPGP